MRCRLAGPYRVRYTLLEQRWCFPAFGGSALLSGCLTQGPSLWPRAYLRLRAAALRRLAPIRACGRSRFATRYRSPVPGVGNPKGRGRSPSPLCRFKGVRGKQAKRRQWRMKRACFEEAARLAAPKRGRKSQCRNGVEIEIPPGFTSAQRNRPRLTGRLMPGLFGGCGGHFSFQKRNVPPLPVPLVRGTKKGQPCG